MDTRKLYNLFAVAGRENPPAVDVTDKVLAILSHQPEPLPAVYERFWMWLAGISSAVAIPAAVYAIIFYSRINDPLLEITQAISWVTQ